MVHSKELEPQHEPDGVHDRVDGPDLMEPDRVDVRSMGTRFGTRQPPEHRYAPCLDLERQIARTYQVLDIVQTPVRVVMSLDHNVQKGALDATALPSLYSNPPTVHTKGGHALVPTDEIDPSISKRTQEHVPAGARGYVHVSDTVRCRSRRDHHRRTLCVRRIKRYQ